MAPEKNAETEQKIQPPSDIAISDIQIRNTDAFEGVADYLSLCFRSVDVLSRSEMV
jgi:hypothetical protein